MTTTHDLDDLRQEISDGCRVMAARGLADGILGHISLRIDERTLLIRCRGANERGLAFTEPSDIRLVTFDGEPGAVGELDGYTVPFELPLHAGVLRARPDVDAVLHAHPDVTIAADLAGIEIRPILGSYDMPGMRLAAGGVPVHPRAVLISSTRLADEMLASLGDRPVVLLRAHGIVTAASDVRTAVLNAISVNTIARFALQIRQAGGELRDVSAADMADLPDLGAGLNTDTAWRHELARLSAGNHG